MVCSVRTVWGEQHGVSGWVSVVQKSNWQLANWGSAVTRPTTRAQLPDMGNQSKQFDSKENGRALIIRFLRTLSCVLMYGEILFLKALSWHCTAEPVGDRRRYTVDGKVTSEMMSLAESSNRLLWSVRGGKTAGLGWRTCFCLSGLAQVVSVCVCVARALY